MIRFSREAIGRYAARHAAGLEAAMYAEAQREGDDAFLFTREKLNELTRRFPLVRVHPPPGLGDRVAAVAQPIARAIDAVLGTHVAECGGCKRRREALNRFGESFRQD